MYRASSIHTRFVLFGLALLIGVARAGAAEVYSNTAGGGVWSDPATWRGGKVPTEQDTAVIAARDTVIYDGGDADTVTCAELSIDPDGVLVIKAAAAGQRRVLRVGGVVEVYGTLRLDGTESPLGSAELLLAGPAKESRKVSVGQRGGLVAYGAPGLEADALNVLLAAEAGSPTIDGDVMAAKGSRLDLRYAMIRDLTVSARQIDNTGFEVGQGLMVVGCTFTHKAGLALYACDTPRVIGNRFEIPAGATGPSYALSASSCMLPELRGNRFIGRHYMSLHVAHSVDAMVVDNHVTGAVYGLYFVGSGAMIRGNSFAECDSAVVATSMSGLMEDTTIRNSATGLSIINADIQVTDCRWLEPRDGAQPCSVTSSNTTLLNCPFTPEQVKLGDPPKKDADPWIRSMSYLVVAVKGNLRPGLRVSVRTAGLAEDQPDPNVRHTPAPLAPSGTTPSPRSRQPLMVTTWTVNSAGVVQPTPSYTVTVWEPAGADGQQRKVLATATVRPDASWHRPDPGEERATVELTLP